jgi:RHS repeat-associated protein
LQLGNGAVVSRQYDALMRLTNVANHAGANVLSSFAIAVDDADQRTQVVREDGMRYDFAYDAVGQLTNAAATLADDTPWQAYRFGYQYDAAGNPVEQDKNGFVFSNSFNYLNQNVATVPGGSLAVLGRVNYAGGTVTVNSVQAQLTPDLIFAATGIPFALGTNALNTVFTDPFGRSTNRETSVVVTQKAYQYDLNGNLTNDGRMAYFWNDENRLVAVHSAKTGAMIQENRYDGLGRRREKIEHGADGITTNRYLYQDWMVLAVTDGAGNVQETYTHGADLSGQVGGGAGGIGGILASTQAGGTAYYHYDFNGNVVNVSSSNQTQRAKYTYSPFGEVLLKEGPFDSRYQFSTKERDMSTGMNYYGYRFYSPQMGRWINRDPLNELGFQTVRSDISGKETSHDSMANTVWEQLEEYFLTQGQSIDSEELMKIVVLLLDNPSVSARPCNHLRMPLTTNTSHDVNLYLFVRNSAQNMIDSLGLKCWTIFWTCEICTWPDCKPKDFPDPSCPGPAPDPDPTPDPPQHICFKCDF